MIIASARHRGSDRPVLGSAVSIGLAVASMTGAHAAPVVRRASPIPLEAVTFDEAERVGAAGTGCVWLDEHGRRRVFMANDRALVRSNGRIVRLAPAAGALETFPSVFLDWTGPGMRIVIHDTSKVRERGAEFVETEARLELVQAGRKRSWRGRLNCGS
ncbi:hypothetical protein [Sphingomonas panni]|uniref:hypothetical protein n=1 Tax=Sphingomonas panni TaxID=237612 RepID=UPI001F5B40AC|nr:hypothetical protein [Sphingomonas panni]